MQFYHPIFEPWIFDFDPLLQCILFLVFRDVSYSLVDESDLVGHEQLGLLVNSAVADYLNRRSSSFLFYLSEHV